MIDWDTLVGEAETEEKADNSPKSGEIPHALGSDSGKVGNRKTSNGNELDEVSPLSPLSPLVFPGVGNEQEKLPSREGVASNNLRAAKTYICHPIAVSLLLAVCYEFEASGEEILQAIIKLQTIPPLEQVRSWAMLCQSNGIDPHQIIYPFSQSPGKGTDCQGCQHFDMQTIHKPNERKLYHWVCKLNHAILESYDVGKRVLIAPESCNDYLPQ